MRPDQPPIPKDDQGLERRPDTNTTRLATEIASVTKKNDLLAGEKTVCGVKSSVSVPGHRASVRRVDGWGGDVAMSNWWNVENKRSISRLPLGHDIYRCVQLKPERGEGEKEIEREGAVSSRGVSPSGCVL
ncbi:hypothetical protein Bbelb_353480 [Branchiostoma belcheri]|nr:hypothetical protein Bbelb_353480 [Branchiostoma belcheri]